MQRILLLLIIIAVGVTNYKIFSFDKGIVDPTYMFETNEEAQITNALSEAENVNDIEKIYYYKAPFNEEKFVIILYLKENSYIVNGTQEDITMLQIGGIIINNVTPREIEPINILFYIGAIILIGYFIYKIVI